MLPLEAVPNFSEGRDRATIDAIGGAMAEHARLLDVHSDDDHNRSVYTLVGSEEELVAALVAGITCARERIDLRRHEGAHPRIGAADVVPLVPIQPSDAERARAAAVELARRVGEELRLPVFLYADLAPGRGPAFFRRGGPAELQQRIHTGEVTPDFGPVQLDERAGGVIVGARAPLIAFNVDLAGNDLEAAREVARAVRERDGGFPGVRALGLRLPRAGHVQVSLNVEDWRASPLHEVVAAVQREAATRGLRVTGSELVGLLPAGAAVAAAGSLLGVAGLDPSHVLELRLLTDGSLAPVVPRSRDQDATDA
jgi:glutamate formiminotransferase